MGLGGAAFPTHVKLVPPKGSTVRTLIINGAECEPYLTSDHRTMVEYPERVHFGCRIMMHTLGVSKAVIGVERNKPDAIAALERTRPAGLDVTILPLTVKYPQGAEKMLIKAVTGVEVPSGKLPVTCRRRGSERGVARRHRRGVRHRHAPDRTHRHRHRPRPHAPDQSHRAGGHTAARSARPLRRRDQGCRGGDPRRSHDGHGPGQPRRPRDQGDHRCRGAGRARDASRNRLSLHPLRALPRGLPGLPQSLAARRLRPRSALRRDGGPSPGRLHALRGVLVRLPVQHPAVAALPGGQGGAASHAAGGERREPRSS